MDLDTIAWIATAAYAVHILEEYTFDWRNWARSVIRLPVEWSDFYVTNAVVVVLGICQAMLAPKLPVAPLVYAALMIINATFFHVLPFLRARGRFSPGLVTALVLFYPIGIATFVIAAPGIGTVVGAVVGGALLMAAPVVMLTQKSRPYFRQDRA